MNPTAPAALDALHHGAPIVWLRENPLAYPALETASATLRHTPS